VSPKAEVKNVKVFIETQPLGVKIDAEHAGVIIFTPKSSKTDEFSHYIFNHDSLSLFSFFPFFKRLIWLIRLKNCVI
jgi:hypothetical protein